MELRFWAATDTGRVRDHNEDNFLVDQNLRLFVVCDGMGGHAAGEVASAVCVRTVRDVVAAEQGLLSRLEESPDDKVAVESLKQLLRRAVLSACRRIFEMAQQDPSRRGMGTTCVAAVLVGEYGFVGHVGDSRMYRIRQGDIDQITDDHSLLNEMIRQGKVPPETTEAEFPHNNAVTRAVGVRESVEVDAFAFDIEEGDRLLMCSDGLSEYFDPSVDLMQLMGTAEPEETTNHCIDFANSSGGKDNITVVVVDCGPPVEEDTEEGPGRAEVIEILRTTPYFHYLAPPELEQIRQMATRIDVEADEDVVADDEDNDRLYLILKGSVSLQLDGEQVSVLTTGEHFGEMALIDAQDEKDTNLVARTVEPSIFLTLERDQFVGLLRSEPGLAIKLLWNFVQVFADRLQSVPPEYRFTPDEWRSDPDAIADVTPPAGTLVFEEDLERVSGQDSRASAGKKGKPVVKGPPALPGQTDKKEQPQIASSADPTGAKTSIDVDSPSTSASELRETVELNTVSREGMDTIPPESGEEDDEGPSVAFNSPKAGGGGRGESAKDASLSSGTYDQSLLEAGSSESLEDSSASSQGDEKEEFEDAGPTVTINRSAAPDVFEGNAEAETPTTLGAEETETPDESSTSEDAEDGLKKTMKFDWNATEQGGPPPLKNKQAKLNPSGPAKPSTGGDSGEQKKGALQEKAIIR